MYRLIDITETVQRNFPNDDIELIEKAYIFSAKVHKGQVRYSGEPYLTHPLEVAGILADMKMDAATVATALLHDTLEDTYADIKEIREIFNDETADMVDGVTKISKMDFSSAQERQAENYRKMILAMAKDIRVVMVKLADRIHNMRTLQYHPKEERRQAIARETLDIYAPLAMRLGIEWMRVELEDLAFKYLYPEMFMELKNEVEKRVSAGRDVIREVEIIIRNKLAENGLKADIKSRTKHLYSIYSKMLRQNIDIDQVYDLVAFRILLDSKPECYEALGIIHALWKPVPGRFKDYIAVPKANSYQSLHTTVVGPQGRQIEIQIRTHEMHRIADEGIAAHWVYKEGRRVAGHYEQKFTWLRQLLESNKEIKDPREFMETVKVDLFPEEVMVFTPMGDVKSFPAGATAIDFAYAIHTEVGEHCVGARVNGQMVPLKYELKNGDKVEIITSSFQHPHRDWLRMVKTSKARNKIKHWVDSEEKKKSVALGREILEKELRKGSINLGKITKSGQLKRVYEDLKFSSEDELMASIAKGKTSVKQIRERLLSKGVSPESPASASIGRIVRRIRKQDEAIVIKGIDDVMFRFGKCCSALPGDDVVGYITRGQGVTVHRANCPRMRDCDQERVIAVSWKENLSEQTFPASFIVLCSDKTGMLADFTKIIALEGANISFCNAVAAQDGRATCNFTIQVKDLPHLNKVLSAIQKVKGVINIRRLNY